ncbi:MAG: hypothetical protein IJX42_03300 [Oscillospiraceae bacterium]|nr:hypothetical protein [Oscillospiraceae bacterium]
MEERKVKKSSKSKNNMMLKIVSVVLAVVLWIILSITMFPTIYTTVYDVPVKLDISGTFADENGLSVVNFNENTTVDVKLSGMRYEIGNYSADDLVASVEVKDVFSDGTYELAISVKSAHGDDFNIVKVTPSTCKVKFDYNQSREFPIEVEYTGISADEGYVLKTPVCEPETITISGPENEISKINRAVVLVKGNKQKLTETFSTDDTEIVLYSNNGDVMDKSDFEFSTESFNVTFPVFMSKSVPFSINVKQQGNKFDASSLKFTFDPETINVQSTKDISLVEKIDVGSVNLNEISLDSEFEFDVTLENDIINASGIDKVTAKLDSTGLVSKKFTIDQSNIRILNKPANKAITVNTEKITDVTLIGPKDVMSKLTNIDVVAEYSMQAHSIENGNVEVQATIYAQGYDDVWYSGDVKYIIFNVSDPDIP